MTIDLGYIGVNYIDYCEKVRDSLEEGNLEEYKEYRTKTYIELNIDDIEDKFVIDKKYNFEKTKNLIFTSEGKSLIKDFKDIKTGIDNSRVDTGALVYIKDNKFFAMYLEDSTRYFITLIYLKKMKEDNPNLEIPSFVCKVANYNFDQNSINSELADSYLNSLESLIKVDFPKLYITESKKSKLLFDIRYEDRNGINIKKTIERDDKNQLIKEIELLEKAKTLNKYNKDKKIILEIGDESVFIQDDKEINVEIEYANCLSECKKNYTDNLNELNQLYDNNYSKIIHYKETIQKINSYNNSFNKYTKMIESFEGKLRLLNKKNRKVKYFNDNFLDDNYLENINDSLKKFNEYDLNSIDLTEINDKNIKLIDFIKYTKKYFDSINLNLKNTDNYLEELEEQQSQIENQPILKILKEPIKLNRKPLIFNYPIKEEINEEEKDRFAQIEKKQEWYLNQPYKYEYKYDLKAYKSFLYRAINKIVKLKRTKKDATDEEIEKILQEEYLVLKKRYSSAINTTTNLTNYSEPNPLVLIRNGKPIEYEEYSRIVRRAVGGLEILLKSPYMALDEPLTVYRGVSKDDIDKKEIGFLSTSFDPKVTQEFLNSGRTDNGTSVIYKINLPAGSPVVFFSTALFTDEIIEGNPYADDQKEILIDADNFEFTKKSVKLIDDVDIGRDNKKVYLVELDARYKYPNLGQEIPSEELSLWKEEEKVR